MKRGIQGRELLQKMPVESFKAFVPAALPVHPAILMDNRLVGILERANLAIGRLDGLSIQIKDVSLFLYFYVRKEAVLSSQIEGTQSTLTSLLLFESDEVPGVPLDDVREVSNYVAALQHGMQALENGQPLTLRLIREIHGLLLAQGRGEEKQPGEFRRTQNWIGGTRPGNAVFVPPPAHEIMGCLDNWEKYLHNKSDATSTLVKAALLHLQFETIHPFLDGNGRVGRLLIPLLLCAEEVLAKPLLYLSLFFKSHKDEYYQHLQQVRLEGDWESWIMFFLTGVEESAKAATSTAQAIVRLIEEETGRIQAIRGAGNVLRLHTWMQTHPIFKIAAAADALSLSNQTVNTCVERLQSLGVVRETTGRNRNRVFVYNTLINVMSS